ncbi:MAG: Gar1/Naf1 family protein [Candidatus Geothermarchaeota archaeon]
MKEIGKILHYTKSKVFVIETNEKVPLRTEVFDDREEKIGIVIDIIGPTNKPYLVAMPLVEEPYKYVGKTVYILKKKATERR